MLFLLSPITQNLLPGVSPLSSVIRRPSSALCPLSSVLCPPSSPRRQGHKPGVAWTFTLFFGSRCLEDGFDTFNQISIHRLS